MDPLPPPISRELCEKEVQRELQVGCCVDLTVVLVLFQRPTNSWSHWPTYLSTPTPNSLEGVPTPKVPGVWNKECLCLSVLNLSVAHSADQAQV